MDYDERWFKTRPPYNEYGNSSPPENSYTLLRRAPNSAPDRFSIALNYMGIGFLPAKSITGNELAAAIARVRDVRRHDSFYYTTNDEFLALFDDKDLFYRYENVGFVEDIDGDGYQDYLTVSGQNTLEDSAARDLERAMYCLKDRAKTYPEVLDKAHFVLTARPITRDDKSAQMLDTVHKGILAELTPHLQNASWNHDTLESIVQSLAEAHDTKLGKLAGPLRAALAGRSVSPSVFDMMLVLGREETVLRLTDATA